MKRTLWTLTAAGLLLAACGKNDALSTQDSLRGGLMDEASATYTSAAHDSKIYSVTIDAKDKRTDSKMTFERVTYLDPECTVKYQTFRQAGTVQFVNDYKGGYLNSMVFQPSDTVSITYHTDEDVIKANNALTAVRNATETPIRDGASVSEALNTTRENQKLRAARDLTPFKRDEEKVLNRLQVEKIGGAIGVSALVEQNSMADLRYELDYGYLVMQGPGDFAGVYTKKQ